MKKNEFINGIKDGFPICLGYFSVSMAFGLTATKNGIPIWAAVLTSLSNLTSAGQFAGINIMIASGTLLELALTTLIINMRYFLMSLSVSQKIDSSVRFSDRFFISFGITDEIFAVSMRHRKTLKTSYMAGLILTPVLGWTSGTAIGSFAATLLPEKVAAAMGIALYGMFIAIIVPPAAKNKNVLISAVLAICVSVIFRFTPFLKSISDGWVIIIVTVLVSAICATLFPVKEENS